MSRPFRLVPSFREKIWGVANLEPWFRRPERKTGEVWFLHPDGDPLPVLVKFIFTSERLSVQVHPPDEYARRHDGMPGKTEMWYILRAEPGARLAMGPVRPMSRRQLRETSLTGEIERLVRWFPASPGQVWFIPPGTIHALGPGITLCEIQQNSDNTYRLYDYGRPRELHVDKAVDVACLEPHPGPSTPQGNLLAACDYFLTERLELSSPIECRPGPEPFQLLTILEGRGLLGPETFAQGEVWMVPRDCRSFDLSPEGAALLLRTWLPAKS